MPSINRCQAAAAKRGHMDILFITFVEIVCAFWTIEPAISGPFAEDGLVEETAAASPQLILPQVEPASLGLDEKWLRAITDKMSEFVAAKEIAGAVTLVAYRGAIVHLAAVGHACLDPARPMQPDSIFAVASMTKPIVATGLLILASKGQVGLDEPVATYLPEFAEVKLPDGSSPRRAMTVKHLLTHTSGLYPEQRMRGDLAETVRFLAAQPLQFEPGSGWSYGPGLTVAGRIIEVVSGKTLEEFLRQEIFEPLAMTDTTFHLSVQQKGRLAHLYEKDQLTGELRPASHWLIDLSPEAPPNPSGGLFSTAHDLARFYQAVLNGGILGQKRILSPQFSLLMRTVHTDNLTTGFTPGNGWGLGWCVVREPQGVTAMLSPGSFGHGGAFGTQGWIDPTRQMILILLIQRLGLDNADQSPMREAFQRLAVASIKAGNL